MTLFAMTYVLAGAYARLCRLLSRMKARQVIKRKSQ